ncbi:hypothetical protein SDC9_08380 [bioreactor metagenome]|uniref:DGC domain-containing protein n=1 Tax=bioreactor metagenome TaxID=1076179 RepID=A0A644T7E3_9ZZZZ|nr:putative zinc-binding protein [Methanobrevibacter sp.]MEA4957314.1 putative zinc-binding protein [Methanobrevibacter sp.]
MKDKVSVAACSGMSNFGLICRAVASDLSESEEDIVSICITSTAADDKTTDLIKKYPIIALNGCSNECVNKILKKKDINVDKSINAMKFAKENNLNAGEVARLGEEGEKTTKELKKHILKKIKE